MKIRKRYMPELYGKKVYPWWRLDKNISWYNVNVYPMGIIFGLITLEWLTKRGMSWRLNPGKFWLPPKYAEGYYEECVSTSNTAPEEIE